MVSYSLKIIFFVAKFALRHQENVFPILRSILLRNKKIRVSMAALLEIEDDNKYVLVKNHHRKEYYAPFGGVFKHSSGKLNIFDKIEWNSDYTRKEDSQEDMKNDLRGIIYGKKFPDFISWFDSRKERESEQCIYRELKEELLEGKVGNTWRNKSSEIKIELSRQVLEGPYKIINNKEYDAQFRYFEIFRLDQSDDNTKEFIEELIKRGMKNENNLILVTKDEIEKGRTSADILIGPQTKYFFNSAWHGNEPTPYV